MSKILATCAAVVLAAVPLGRASGQSSARTIADDPAMLALAIALARTPPPSGAPSADEAGIVELAGTVAADALVFAAVPTLRGANGAAPPRVWWTAETVNLPLAIEPGVAYRDVVIRFTLAGRMDEIWAMLLDAGEAARGIRIYGNARTYAPVGAPALEPSRAAAAPAVAIPRWYGPIERHQPLRIAAAPAFASPIGPAYGAPAAPAYAAPSAPAYAAPTAPAYAAPTAPAYAAPEAYTASTGALAPAPIASPAPVAPPPAAVTVTISIASSATTSVALAEPALSAAPPSATPAATPAGASPRASVVALPFEPLAPAPSAAPQPAAAPPLAPATPFAPGQPVLAPSPAPCAVPTSIAEPPSRPGVTPLSMPDPPVADGGW
jgi:hypothetical protein